MLSHLTAFVDHIISLAKQSMKIEKDHVDHDNLLDFMNMTEAKYSGYGLAITYSNIGKAKEIHMQ